MANEYTDGMFADAFDFEEPAPEATGAGLNPGATMMRSLKALPGKVGNYLLGAAKDVAKDDMTAGAAMIALGPMAMNPIAARAAGKVIRGALPGEPDRPIGEELAEGATQGAVEAAFTAAGPATVALRRAPAAIIERLGKDRMTGAVGEMLRKLASKGVGVEAQQAAASKVIESAVKAAGDERVAVNKFLDLAESYKGKETNELAGALTKMHREVIGQANKIAERNTAEGGATKNLGELQDAIAEWGARAKGLANKPRLQKIALDVKDALLSDLEEATGDTVVGEAARTLKRGRAMYAESKLSEELAETLVASQDPLSLTGHIEPRKLAVLSSGKRGQEIQKKLAAYPDRQKAWNTLVDASRMLAKKGRAWLPESARSEQLSEMLGNLMTARNIGKMIEEPALANELSAILSRTSSSSAPEAVAGALTSIYERLNRVSENATARLLPATAAKPADDKQPPIRFAGGQY